MDDGDALPRSSHPGNTRVCAMPGARGDLLLRRVRRPAEEGGGRGEDAGSDREAEDEQRDLRAEVLQRDAEGHNRHREGGIADGEEGGEGTGAIVVGRGCDDDGEAGPEWAGRALRSLNAAVAEQR